MRILAPLASLWRTLRHKERLDHELDDELRAAVDTLADRYAALGLSPREARRAAAAELGGRGGLEQVKADVRDGRIGAGLDAMLLDLRYAWRTLWRAPAVTAVIVATLALGIGANVAIFSVVHAMLLQPLPYREADRLAFIWLERTDLGYARGPLSGPDLRDLRAGARTFAALGGIWATGTVALTGDGDPEQLRAAFVTDNFFDVLGAGSALGRTFRREDTAPGAPPTVLLGWDLFARRFGADPALVGRRIVINDQLTTVIGVMPKTFRLLLPLDSSVPDHLQIWQPFWPDLENGPRGNLFLRVVGRMRPGVTIADAREEVAAVASHLSRELGRPRRFTTVALQADDVREIRGPLLALFAGVGILLLIACVNVAGLLVARAAARSRETSLRLALGASRGRLVRQSLIEGILLTLLGAAAGLLAGAGGLRGLLALAPESLARLSAARIDLTVLTFTLAIAAIWGLLFSLAPTVELFRTCARGSALWDRTGNGHAGTGGRGAGSPVRYRTRAALAVVQIAASVVLLACAGLLVRAFIAVARVDPGFVSDRHLTFRVALPDSRYPSLEALVAADRELQRRLAALPGVTHVGAISHLPYDDLPNWGLTYASHGAARQDVRAIATARSITPGLFETLGVQLVEGRFFKDDEGRPPDPPVIVDEMLAQQLWPGRSAIGQRFMLGQGEPNRVVSVVGVVRHLKLRSLVDDVLPQVYLPYRLWLRSPMAYVVRMDAAGPSGARDLSARSADVRAAVAGFDPRLPVFEIRPLEHYVEAARSIRRFTMLVAAVFAGCALLLTCVGVYGVLAYSVTIRRHEFGVRRALGADAARVLRDVLQEGLRFALIGGLCGLAGAGIAARLLQSQLYAVHPRDPISYLAAVALVFAGALVACGIPAYRATTISPMDALRAE